MSKKMLKRSLALGALMAFVITGQAWAAIGKDVTSGENEITDSKIVLKADGNVWALSVQGDGTKANVINPVTITAEGTSWAVGVYNSGANIEFANNANITAEATSGRARAVDMGSGNTSNTIFKGDAYLSATANIANGVYASGANPQIVKFEKSLTVDVTGTTEAVGLFAQNGGSIEVAGDAKINVASTTGEADGIFNQHGDQTGNGGGTVSLLGNVEINATSTNGDAYAILNWDNAGNTTVGTKDVSKVIINGDVYAKSGTVNVNLGTADSKLTGAVTTEGGATTINMAEGATWDASNTDENTVTTLNGTGTIILATADDKVTAGGGEADLTVRMNGAFAEDIASKSGEEQAAELAEVAGQVTGVTVTQVGTTEGEIAGAITADVAVDDQNNIVVSNVKEAVNTTNQAIGEAAVAMKSHWRAHMNDMNKRMGELRMANGETGVWTRMVRGETEYQGAKAQYNQYQLGYDEKLSTDKRWTVGAAVTFAEGEGSFGKGTTEDDSTAFAIYGSKLNNDGTFVDLIARYAHMESDVTVGADKADYDVNGYSVSAEFGKRIQQGKGFWIEPQVELTYGSVDSAEYVIGGKTVQVGDMDSIIGRVGFSLGKDIKQGNVYARASYLYDFDGETESTFGNGTITRTIEEDLGGGWWEVGVGANINLSKATYIYADVEKTFGGEVDTNWQWNLGVRYSF